MKDVNRYLKLYFSSLQPYRPKERRYSSLVLGLRDARLITNRDLETGKVSFEIPAPLMPCSWAGTTVYLIALELIGTCFRPKGGSKADENAIYLALRYFSNLTESEARAVESLRHSFAHNYGLINVQRRRKDQQIVPSRTHHFLLTAEPKGKAVIERKELWDGEYKSRRSKNTTRINVWALGDLVEAVFAKLVEENAKKKIDLILEGGIQELKARYTVII